MPIKSNLPLIVITLGFSFLFLMGIFVHTTHNLEKIKAGDKTLVCYIDNQHKIIDPAKIETKVSDTYIFTNGYASNCKVLDVPYSTFGD